MTDPTRVVELGSRSGYRPVDMRDLARRQVREARERLDLSYGEFASLLTPLLGWPVSHSLAESWETPPAAPPGDVLMACAFATRNQPLLETINSFGGDLITHALAQRYSDVVAIYATRDALSAAMPPRELFEGASHLRLSGLSLNVLCQQYPDHALRELIENGTQVQALFLDPAGAAIAAREREEGHPPGHLAALTQLNIEVLTQRVRDRLTPAARDRLQIGIYDETLRVNLCFVGEDVCVAQWYLPDARGVDCPSLVVHPQQTQRGQGLFLQFEQVFSSLWRGMRQL